MWARGLREWSRRRDSNPEPAVYKTAALPIELRRPRTANQGLSERRGMIGRLTRTGQARPLAGRFVPRAEPVPRDRARATWPSPCHVAEPVPRRRAPAVVPVDPWLGSSAGHLPLRAPRAPRAPGCRSLQECTSSEQPHANRGAPACRACRRPNGGPVLAFNARSRGSACTAQLPRSTSQTARAAPESPSLVHFKRKAARRRGSRSDSNAGSGSSSDPFGRNGR